MKNPVPQKMTAVFINPENGSLFTKEVVVPMPKKGEVLIKMIAAPINPSDLAKIREITAEETEYFIPGIEGCGTVVAAGKGLLPRLFLGKRVACSSTYKTSGTWAEYMLTKAGSCFPVSKRISGEQAAMTIVNPMTALAFLDFARKNKHHAVVNTAAASALGKITASLFEKHHIKVLNIVRNEASLRELEKQHRQYVLNSMVPDFPVKFKEWCDQMHATLVFDAVGGELVNRVLDLLPANSTIMLYGNLSGEKIEFLPTQLVRENKKITGFFLGQWITDNGMIKTILNLMKVNALLKKGMETPVQAVYSLDKVQQAVELYEKNMGKGKVLLKAGEFVS
jgi:NADPH:quinone reductase-like Zn-dependent oxidoreductase